jgi:hypothetical protein
VKVVSLLHESNVLSQGFFKLSKCFPLLLLGLILQGYVKPSFSVSLEDSCMQVWSVQAGLPLLRLNIFQFQAGEPLEDNPG